MSHVQVQSRPGRLLKNLDETHARRHTHRDRTERGASATVAATTPSVVLCVDGGALDALYRDDPKAGTAFMNELCATLASRIRASTDTFENLTTGSVAPPPTTLLGILRSLFGGSKRAK